jgi:rod shape determining protein RodA
MRNTFYFRDLDWILLAIALGISFIGILEIYSTTSRTHLSHQWIHQVFWVAIGCCLAVAVSSIDYHLILDQTPWLYGLTILSLGALLIGGAKVGGTRRWIHVAGFTLQVSEFAKLVIMLMVVAELSGIRARSVTWWQLAKIGVLTAIPMLLVALEPDLGTALTFLPIVVAAVFLAGVRGRQVGLIVLVGLLALPIGWRFLRPYQRARLETFFHPSQNTQGASYQLTETKIAIGSGGIWGKGLGNGTQSQLGFIPVSHADAIFAAYAEEEGFVGTLLALALYLGLLLRLLDGAQQAADRAGALLLVAFSAILFSQVAVNVGMMIGLFPITGIPLPLMSQGGSAALSVFLGLGLAMGVKKQRFVN